MAFRFKRKMENIRLLFVIFKLPIKKLAEVHGNRTHLPPSQTAHRI